MNHEEEQLWRAKLAAWTHDPPEKALILMRTAEGHERGTVAQIRKELFPEGLTAQEKAWAQLADHWSAAADRPQFPQNTVPPVYFFKHPELIHPLSGQCYPLQPLAEIEPEAIKALSLDRLRELHTGDLRQTALAFWRFVPEMDDAHELNGLWDLLPADSRIPDHSTWAHLDLVSALAGAFAADARHGSGEAALFTLTLGPVQEFIAVARKASDLWAGSHLLSMLAWQAMQVVCERYGPDAVLFPQLRGVPLADAWLEKACGLPAARFAPLDWKTRRSDANPLFYASLPNKFAAIVPAAAARELAEAITARVREFVKIQATAAAELLGLPARPEQLAEFPEVHWASVPWTLAQPSPDTTALEAAAQPFYGGRPAWFESPAWKLLSKQIKIDDHPFYTPNPGTLYPVLYDLQERLLAAAKSFRPFEQLEQAGARCSLCGERDALGSTQQWEEIAASHPRWAKKKEHLCSLCALKRLWPELFRGWAREHAGVEVDSFNVSTHTMALATSFGQLLEGDFDASLAKRLAARLIEENAEPVALPQALARADGDLDTIFRRLPDALDSDDEKRAESFAGDFKALAGVAPEKYYAFILMDGDHMGRWLSGGAQATTFEHCFHSQVRETLRDLAKTHPALRQYLDQPRPSSPAQHMAISEALHAFSAAVAPHVVERLFKGKLIYAGGDDLLAMVSIDDLLACMAALRAAFRGDPIPKWAVDAAGFDMNQGFAHLDGSLHRLMGDRATASMGAVVTHFSNPLGRVLRELRAAEHDAKESGRNAFSLRLLKRSGGATHLTLPFACEKSELNPLAELDHLRTCIADPKFSRRGAYHIVEQLPQLPPQAELALYQGVLGYQFDRQGGCRADGVRLAQAACALDPEKPEEKIQDLLVVAEFLAREGRATPAATPVAKEATIA